MNHPQQHWNPAAHQQPTGYHPAAGFPQPRPPRPTGLIVGIAVTAVLAIAATTTAIVVATSGPSTSAPSPTTAGPVSAGSLGGGRAPVVLSSSDGAGTESVGPRPTESRTSTGTDDSEGGDGGVDSGGNGANGNGTNENGQNGNNQNGNGQNGTGTDGDGGNSDGGNGDGGNGDGGNGGVDTNGGGGGNGGGNTNGTGSRPPGTAEDQKNAILQSAISWIDARNAGDGNQTLQLGCSDDVTAVQAGQPNPAMSAGYTAYRPTGEVIGHSSGLAAYVVISSQNLQTGATQPSRLPIIWEQGAWRMCYYPGAETNRITGG